MHHIAFRCADDLEQVHWREQIAEHGLHVTPVIDRFYFHSIYFREPGGILFEIATEGPGFTVDEPAERLGETLKLTPAIRKASGRDRTDASANFVGPKDTTVG